VRRPPEFIKVTTANKTELQARAQREPHVLNGLMRPPRDADYTQLDVGDTVAFPWPDPITELGQLAGDAECELRGEPLPAWPISRLRLEPGDIMIVRVGIPEGAQPGHTQKMLESCKAVFREVLEKAGYGEEVQTIFIADNIDISVIAASADRKGGK
jgi:hypothetical protein